MPLYEYECEKCAHRFERIQKFSDPLVDVCPVCAGVVRKLLSSPAIQFKGAGWYITDYARKGGGGDSSTSDSSKTDATKTDSAKSDSKNDSAKSESKGSSDSTTKSS